MTSALARSTENMVSLSVRLRGRLVLCFVGLLAALQTRASEPSVCLMDSFWVFRSCVVNVLYRVVECKYTLKLFLMSESLLMCWKCG
ncbi:hypothetical protein EV401DRAFT_1234226 [Pisolithus croceorrhizus]|nr:hypothetical protein EV401DRAFT_1234226 [Pisolithus croceorrhizus]